MEEIIEEPGALTERVAALDIGKATLTACIRVPHEGKPGARRRRSAPTPPLPHPPVTWCPGPSSRPGPASPPAAARPSRPQATSSRDPRRTATGAALTQTFLASAKSGSSGAAASNRAQIAVGNSMLTITWHLLSDPAARFTDLGPDWHDRLGPATPQAPAPGLTRTAMRQDSQRLTTRLTQRPLNRSDLAFIAAHDAGPDAAAARSPTRFRSSPPGSARPSPRSPPRSPSSMRSPASA